MRNYLQNAKKDYIFSILLCVELGTVLWTMVSFQKNELWTNEFDRLEKWKTMVFKYEWNKKNERFKIFQWKSKRSKNNERNGSLTNDERTI